MDNDFVALSFSTDENSQCSEKPMKIVLTYWISLAIENQTL